MLDTSLVEKDARQVLENSPQRDVLFFFAHPDSLIAFSTMKEKLEKEYGKKVTTALLMTDHFQKYDQHTWARLEADMILAPDARSAELTEKRINERAEEFFGAEKDKYRLPIVLNVHGYPVELGLKEKISEPEFSEKKSRLSSDLSSAPRILIPLGGSLPQRDLIAGISANLITKEGYGRSERVTVLHKKEGQEYETFVFAMKRNGTKVVSTETTDEAIDETHQYLAGINGNFDILLTKPSEKVNVAQFAPDKAGGLIMAFLPPVGSQEEENLRFFRSYEGGHILLSELQEKRLYKFLHKIDKAGVLRLAQEGRLRQWQEKAKNLRGVTLPEDPKEAAFILYACKKYGIFEAMTEWQLQPQQNADLSEDGAILTLEKIEDGLWQIEESRNRDKPTFIHEMPRVKNPENLSKIDHLRILLGVSPEDKLYEFFTLENIQILAKYLGQMSILGLEEKLARAKARRLLKE